MSVYSYFYVHFKTKSFFWFGLTIGFLLSINYSTDDFDCGDWPLNIEKNFDMPESLHVFEPKLNLAKKPLSPKKVPKTFIRPRYYSTELGIREKLFVGVLTSFENLENVGVAINVTIGQVVNKIKYFVQALNNHERQIPVNNVVGFTDSREIHRPFHVFKYMADNFIQEFDYFFLMTDKAYINGNRLKHLANKISVTEDVYAGVRLPDSSYCSLAAGILLSNNVVQKIKENLDWCVKNAISHDPSDNIGRCIVHSVGKECQETIQTQKYRSFRAKYYSFQKHLKELVGKPDLINAISVYPVINATDMYVLHSYFSKHALVDIKQQMQEIRASILATTYLHPVEYRNISWPLGEKKQAVPNTRHDLRRYDYINTTHIFMRNDFTGIATLNPSEKADIEHVLNAVVARINFTYADRLKFRRLINGYRQFDPNRGLNYVLDVGLKNLHTGKEIIKRYEVCKSLGRSEILPVPYVTENTRITILLPICESEIQRTMQFIDMYAENIMTRREKTFLMLVFLYGFDTPSKGSTDIYNDVKRFAQKINDKQKMGSSKIAWVSIRFPSNKIERDNKAVNIAIIDLALKKVGLDALVLLLDVYVDVKYDFLNRVRMNTIAGYQVFSPIPFTQYNPQVSEMSTLDLSKNVGQFDTNEFQYISFYARDYVKIRKRTEKSVPIVRADIDISSILNRNLTNFANVLEYFIINNKELHYFRSVEPSLKIKFHTTCATNSKTIRLGSKTQLAKLLLDYSSRKI